MAQPSDNHRLPDMLEANLKVVFVGTAAGRSSAAVSAYYAHPGNRFWRTLHDVGITPREYKPREFRKLLELGIGFTDMSKVGCGMDHQIKQELFDARLFEANIRKHQPRAIAFTSKKAASLWLGKQTSAILLGRQKPRPPNFPEVFVLPSPSGAASRYWNLEPWRELSAWLKTMAQLH